VPGKTNFLALLPKLPKSVSFDGKEIEFEADERKGCVKFVVTAEQMPVDFVLISSLKWRSEPVNAKDGKVAKRAKDKSLFTVVAPLDDMNWHDNGLYRYETEFVWDGKAETLLLTAYAPDPKLVLLNGRFIPEASNNFRSVQVPLKIYARKGRNTLTVLYEQPGRPNGGPGMNELKGIAGAILIGEGAIELSEWRMKKTGQIDESAPEVRPEFEDASWTKVRVGHGHQPESVSASVLGSEPNSILTRLNPIWRCCLRALTTTLGFGSTVKRSANTSVGTSLLSFPSPKQ
jgi:hypothetical protein